MTIKRSVAIKKFLQAATHADLAALYNENMEVQVNVAQDGGQRMDTGEKGTRKLRYTDGVQNWSNFRIPRKAMSEPEDNDCIINFEIDIHAEAIGMTGWDWKNKVSKWVAFDFDSITGHSSRHVATLTEAQLEEVKEQACKIPWVTVRKSTGGRGLHLYVFVDNVPTANHTEHQALGRAILGLMSAVAGYDFDGPVDACGGNTWVWGRKMRGTDGLTLVKQGEVLIDYPINWRDHIKVTASKGRQRNLPQWIPENEQETFEQMTGERPRVPLDAEHRKLIDFLRGRSAVWWWDQDHHMLVCSTYDLKCAHKDLKMRGVFDTLASGKDGEQNCFAFPMKQGAWVVRRYSQGVQETLNWSQDATGYTRCFLNRDPDLGTVARTMGGVEEEKGGFDFRTVQTVQDAAKILGVNFSLPEYMKSRRATMKAHKDGRLIIKINSEPDDRPDDMVGWRIDKKVWTRIFNITVESTTSDSDNNYDDLVRHLVSGTGQNAGWVVKGLNGAWSDEPLAHVKAALCSSLGNKVANEVMGSSVLRPWRLVVKPFKPEYPGDRCWNRNSAQLRFTPAAEPSDFPHWSMILNHVGQSLDNVVASDPWCQVNGVHNGHDYLILWCAFLFREPLRSLPYLFLYGPQNSGKSSFHQALSLLFDRKRGYVRVDGALMNKNAFNGEMENAVLCVVEETDLSRQGGVAYDKIKDWVTAPDLTIHPKFVTPYSVPNSCHFVQTANNPAYCPIFKDDTRITMMYVPAFEKEIQRDILDAELEKEAADFLGHLFRIELPQSGRRLAIPMIATQEKADAGEANLTQFEQFLAEQTFAVPGQMVRLSELYSKFKNWLGKPDGDSMTKQKMTSQLSPETPKGRGPDGNWYIGNLSFEPVESGPKLIRTGDRLVPES